MPSWSRGGAAGLGLQPRRFHRQEVQDTDGDGLPEFVDAWGQPLQFFRWPLLYHSDIQRGQVIDHWAYTQLLPRPSPSSSFHPPIARCSRPASRTRWTSTSSCWRRPGGRRSTAATRARPSASLGPAHGSVSQRQRGVQAFEYFFHRLTEPLPAHRRPRTLLGPRRRPILPPGLLLQVPDPLSAGPTSSRACSSIPSSGAPAPISASHGCLIANENNAMPFSVASVERDLRDFTAADRPRPRCSSTVTYPTHDPELRPREAARTISAIRTSRHRRPEGRDR